MSFTVVDENDGQLSTSQGASQSCFTATGENGGECVSCGWNTSGIVNHPPFLCSVVSILSRYFRLILFLLFNLEDELYICNGGLIGMLV